jgi:hypothetical protein
MGYLKLLTDKEKNKWHCSQTIPEAYKEFLKPN